MEPSSDSLIKYVSCYRTVLIWIQISATYHNVTIHETATQLQEFFQFNFFFPKFQLKII
jgi:hypothetical protein